MIAECDNRALSSGEESISSAFRCVKTNTFPKAKFLLINSQVIETEMKKKHVFKAPGAISSLSFLSSLHHYLLFVPLGCCGLRSWLSPYLKLAKCGEIKSTDGIDKVLFHLTRNSFHLATQSQLGALSEAVRAPMRTASTCGGLVGRSSCVRWIERVLWRGHGGVKLQGESQEPG